VLKRLENVIREVFGDQELNITPAVNIRHLPEWDSFNHINLMIALESEFKVLIPPRRAESVQTVDDIVKLLEATGAKL
jgi:acyl carrier protein